ncbi:MAG TPA: hypothetical protein VHL31_00930 [Geminicoccus sp.]|uniref:hypothetical protein n=1 Tax=Geminicoccus sp. TaxID=2024832 RepID=UPI002E2EB6CA|nr:hypothetical protein [Geminicoccus sp.]HEX2524853.1 hypothetical protein [Geminicoccus sp.]
MSRKSKSAFVYYGHRLWFHPTSGIAYVCWNRPGGSTNRRTLDTTDLHEAIERLKGFVDLNVRLPETAPERLPLRQVLARYNQDYVRKLPSAAQNGPALDRWAAFFGENAMVAEVMDRRRRAEFRFWLEQLEYPKRHRDPETGAIVETMHRMAPSTIRRTVEMGNAAFSWAQREGLLTHYEPMPLPPPSPPRRYAPKQSDLVKLWDAAEPFRLRLFIALLVHTCGRPEAVLDLTSFQCDLEDDVIHLNAEGRKQTKKTRPSIPMTQGIRPWIQAAPKGRLIQYKGKPVRSLIGIWRLTVKAAGLDPRFTPKTLQKLIPRLARAYGVSRDLVGPFKGNANSTNRMMEKHYDWVEIEEMRPVADAIDKLWEEIGQMAVRPISPEAVNTNPATVRYEYVTGGTLKAANPLRLVEPIGIEPTTSTVQTRQESRKTKPLRS